MEKESSDKKIAKKDVKNSKKIQSFTFFYSYYNALKKISKEDAKEILYSMIMFVFENKKPKLQNTNSVIWSLIEPVLVKSKINSRNRQKENEIETKTKRNKNEIKSNEKEKQKEKETKQKGMPPIPIPILNNLLLNIYNSNNNINNLFKEYIQLREKNNYTISESVVKRLVNKLNEYGKTEEEKEEIILNAINGKWKDFYPLNREAKKGEIIYETI